MGVTMNNAREMYISIALDAASSMLKEIEFKYPGCEVDIDAIAMDAVETREDRLSVIGGDFPVIGMVHHVCLRVMEQACQSKNLPKEQQDAFWAEFWPDTILKLQDAIMVVDVQQVCRSCCVLTRVPVLKHL